MIEKRRLLLVWMSLADLIWLLVLYLRMMDWMVLVMLGEEEAVAVGTARNCLVEESRVLEKVRKSRELEGQSLHSYIKGTC